MQELIVMPKRLKAAGSGTHLAQPVVVDRRHAEPCSVLCDWVMVTNCLFVLLFGLATFGFTQIPIPADGGRAESIPVAVWFLWAFVVAVLKVAAHSCKNSKLCCAGAKWGFSLWSALTVSVFLPGQAVMSWVFCPMMMAAEAMLYIRLSCKETPRG